MKAAIRLTKPAEKSAIQSAFEQGKKEGKTEALALVDSTTLDPLPCPEKMVWPSTPRQGDASVTYRYGVEYVQGSFGMDASVEIRVARRDIYGEKVLQYSSRIPDRDLHTPTSAEIDESLVRVVVGAAQDIPCDAIALVWAVVPRLYLMVHHTTNPVDGPISDHYRNLIFRIISRLYNDYTAGLFMSQR